MRARRPSPPVPTRHTRFYLGDTIQRSTQKVFKRTGEAPSLQRPQRYFAKAASYCTSDQLIECVPLAAPSRTKLKPPSNQALPVTGLSILTLCRRHSRQRTPCDTEAGDDKRSPSEYLKKSIDRTANESQRTRDVTVPAPCPALAKGGTSISYVFVEFHYFPSRT